MSRSTDEGSTWTSAYAGLTNTAVLALATGLYAGTDGGVFRSTGDGAGWMDVTGGLPSPEFAALAVGLTNLYAGTAAHSVWRFPLN